MKKNIYFLIVLFITLTATISYAKDVPKILFVLDQSFSTGRYW